MNVVRRHTTIEELTPTLLREFVEKIVVHESVALDGKRRGKLRRQEIEIYYSFVGKVELPDTSDGTYTDHGTSFLPNSTCLLGVTSRMLVTSRPHA